MKSKVTLNVEGMTCTNCANTITKVLEKDGLKDVNVSFVTGEVNFEISTASQINEAVKNINKLGYHVADRVMNGGETNHNTSSVEKKFFLCLVFTLPLFMHMFLPFHFLHNPVIQLSLCIPVMLIGISYFGKSGWYSLKSGVPNMDVLIMIGSGAAFIYSVAGMFLYQGKPETEHYLFFETAATIITLVLLGNVIEHRSVKQTATAIGELNKLQPLKAKKIIRFENGNERIIEINAIEIRKDDLLLVNEGDKIPADGKIVWGTVSVNESMITGEGLPVNKTVNAEVVGGTIVESGSLKMIVQKTGEETVLSKIIELVKQAQNSKPPIQKLGDKVSAVFVPAVLIVSLATFFISFLFIHVGVQQSLMRSIAVLVISCPCAMGLATPTAVMVGIGRAAKNGILIKGGNTLESFAKIQTIVFDKTGTLTTGNFKIKKIETFNSDESTVRALLYSLERHSSHPIAKSIVRECFGSVNESEIIHWEKIQEEKGIGISAIDRDGNEYKAGSFSIVKEFYKDSSHTIYLSKNKKVIATVDLEDEIKQDAGETIAALKKQGIKIIMVSGDRKEICEYVAMQLGIEEVFSEQLPEQKISVIEKLNSESPTAMIGDGINDAPALAKATVGISISNATQVAIQSSCIILLNESDLKLLLKARQVSRHTLITIRQNLFWAFFYNVIAIPIAAAGFLNPMIGALSMAFSDVIVIGNSIRLKTKKIS